MAASAPAPPLLTRPPGSDPPTPAKAWETRFSWRRDQLPSARVTFHSQLLEATGWGGGLGKTSSGGAEHAGLAVGAWQVRALSRETGSVAARQHRGLSGWGWLKGRQCLPDPPGLTVTSAPHCPSSGFSDPLGSLPPRAFAQVGPCTWSVCSLLCLTKSYFYSGPDLNAQMPSRAP